MTFLNPLFLIAMTAAAIPLLIHLFNFRKPTRIDFSSLAFLQELQKSTMQRVRIKQWLLLALRTLAIGALVLAFSRPTITGTLAGFGSQGKASSVIVFDNSKSMSLRDGGGAYLEQARNIGTGLIDLMESGDEVFLLPTITSVTTAMPMQSRISARQAVMNISLQGGEMILNEVVRRAAKLLETSANPNRDIYVLSDLQQSTFLDSVEVDFPEDIRVYLLPIGEQVHDNIAISDVRVLSRILSVGEVVRLVVRVQNYGDRAVANLVVSLFLEDERVAQATVNLGPGEIASVPVAVTPRVTGWLHGQVRIQDSDFEADDQRSFTLFIPDRRKLLLVEGSTADSRFLHLALSGEMTTQRVQFDVTRVDETSLATVSIGQFDTIILNGISDMSSGERSSLSRYVKDGGGILLFPGDDIAEDDYNALLSELGAGRISETIAGVGDNVSVAVFDRIDHEHALFEGMFSEDPEGKAPVLEQPEIFRLMPYHPGQADERTLIRMSGDQVFLQEIRSGLGSLILFSVAPTLKWSDFPVRGLFVPLLYRSIYYLAAAGSVTGEEFVEGSAAQLRLGGIEEGASITIESSSGLLYMPELRRVPGGLLASIKPGYLKVGTYDVIFNSEIIRRFSVHPVSRESELKMYTDTDAAQVLSKALGNPVSIIDTRAGTADELKERVQTARTGVELWNVFLLLALFSLIAEMIVEKKWRPETV